MKKYHQIEKPRINRTKLAKLFSDKRGSITPFAVIIATTFVAIFILMFSVLHRVSYMNTQKDYLKVASDDLLLSFDEVLLTDYGLLAYEKEDALEGIISSVKLNSDANSESYFIKESLTEDDLKKISYQVEKTLANRRDVANILVDIAKLHVPLEAIEELNSMYKWSDKINEKYKVYDKYEKITRELERFIDPLEKCAHGLEKINDGFEVDYLLDLRPEIAWNNLSALKEKNEEILEDIKKLEGELVQFSENMQVVTEDVGQLKAEEFMSEANNSIKKFKLAISGEERSINEVKERIRFNIDLIEKIETEDDFDLLEDLNRDFYVYGDDSKKKSLKNILKFFKEASNEVNQDYKNDAYRDIDNGLLGQTSATPKDRISLGVADKILLNEYFLATLKSRVDSPVRNFEMLSRENRRSAYPDGEVEYLISEGRKIDIGLRITALRMAPNTLHILSDKDKFNLVRSVGEKISTINPVAGIVASVAIVGGWAGVESLYDFSELEKGNGVPFMKSDADWYFDIDFDSRANQIKRSSTKSTASDRGDHTSDPSTPQDLSYYNDYLRILLLSTNDNTKIDRYLKLVTKNIKDDGKKDFDIKDYVISHELIWNDYLIKGDYYEK